MNWQVIQTDYPQAYNRLIMGENDEQRWVTSAEDGAPVEEMEMREAFTLRDLYDFFDEEQIYVSINPDYQAPAQFRAYLITDGTQHGLYADSGTPQVSWIKYNSRKDAELHAFALAFELLEKQLS